MMNLNKAQEEVKHHLDGPLLVAAVPGAGKTRCIVERIKYLIDQKIERKSILAVTFTNKAAEEMKLRLEAEGYPVGQMTVSTFHSFCVGILRKCGHLLGFADNFNIYDEKDQLSHIKHVLKELGYLKTTAALKANAANEDDDEVKMLLSPEEVAKGIEHMKNQYLTIEELSEFYPSEMIEAVTKYHEYLRFNNAMDFSDLIYNTCRLFDKYPQLADHFSGKFKHILVDEMQDTNRTQYMLINYLMKINRNIVLVGDEDQCTTEDMKVLTPDGYKQINRINKDDFVMSLCNKNVVLPQKVTKVIKNQYNGKILKITLSNGTTLKCTYNHLIPSNLKISDDYVVYLMEKKGYGFRIGVSTSNRKGSFSSETRKGYISRLCGEHADNIWIIDTAESSVKARLKEQYYSVKYGIPMLVFHTNGRKLAFNNEDIKLFYNSLDSVTGAIKLSEDLHLDLNNPFHRSRMSSHKNDRYTVNVILNGHRNCTHKYSIASNNKEILEKLGEVRKGKSNNWRIEKATKNFEDISLFIQTAKNELNDVFVNLSIKTNYKPFVFYPASYIKTGSEVLIFTNNEVSKHIVTNITEEDYDGYIYDLNVENTHNYIVNGVVVHNSIYSWRYAEPKNIQKFIKEHNPKVVKLETNYRSTPDILNIAYDLIQNNPERLDKGLISVKQSNNGVRLLELDDNKKESDIVARMILKMVNERGLQWSDCAILYRTNMISHDFEESCRRYGIPYKVYGGFGFYDRKEVKTFLSYMKFISNQKDIIAFNNCVNEPKRGIGDTAQIKLSKECFRTGRSLLDLCTNPPTDGPNKLTKKQAEGFQQFATIFNNVDWEHPEKYVRQIAEASGYIEHLIENDRLKGETRSDNVKELVNSFEYWASRREDPKISEYLQEVQLLSNEDDKDIDDNHVRLMTIHAAKGLEFPLVFVVGCEDGLLPHKRSMEETGVEEERRLAYVAITRAKDFLFLTRSKTRWLYGEMKPTQPSRFLYECKLLELKDDEEIS